MLLQPLIENAIKHGIRGKRGRGRLVIKGYREGGDLKFEIADDGAGFVVGELDREDKQPRYKGGGYGIRNVNERIRLEYGGEYGVAITSAPGEGTTSVVTVKMK
jgi:two-component system sensor histidine kinase YesM